MTKPAQKVAKPDLDSHSLIRFLDKFVYRNPKSTDTARGVSIMQPLRANKDLGDIWLGTRASAGATPVNTAAFAKQAANKVAAEDVFFHEYFQHMKTEPKKPKPAADASASLAGDDDEQEDEIWKALVASQPDVEIDDGASDVGFDDLDEDDMASEDGDSPAMSLDSEMEEDDDDDEMGGVEFNDFDDDEEEQEDGKDDLVAADEEKDERTKERERKKSRRKELKALPMFASVDDYAELLGREEDDL